MLYTTVYLARHLGLSSILVVHSYHAHLHAGEVVCTLCVKFHCARVIYIGTFLSLICNKLFFSSTWSYKYKWGCYHPELTYDSGYANTIEGFDNNQGPVVWRKAEFTLDKELMQPQNLTFGVFGPELLDGPGGKYFYASYKRSSYHNIMQQSSQHPITPYIYKASSSG